MSNPFFPFSCATLYGCVCTIRSSESVLKARDYVDMKFACRRLKSLVGEADLCLLWEHISSTPQCTPQKIDHELAKYPDDQRQSAVMAALTHAQDEYGGYLTNDIIELKYIKDMNEWWSTDAANSGKLNIPEGEDCKKQ